MRTPAVTFAIVLLLLLGQGSSTAFNKAFTIEHWSASAYFNDKTKQLEYCSAKSTNKDGITLSYSVDRDFVWKFTVSSPLWDFMVGHTFNVGLKVGEEEYRSQRAVVVENKTLEIQVTDPIALFSRLKAGPPLRIQAGASALNFDLAESDEVLPALVRCITQQLSRMPQPKGRALKPLQIAPTNDVELQEEARSLMTEVLAQSRVAGARFVKLN